MNKMNVTNMFSDSKTKVDYVHILFALCFSQDASGNFLNLKKGFHSGGAFCFMGKMKVVI